MRWSGIVIALAAVDVFKDALRRIFRPARWRAITLRMPPPAFVAKDVRLEHLNDVAVEEFSDRFCGHEIVMDDLLDLPISVNAATAHFDL